MKHVGNFITAAACAMMAAVIFIGGTPLSADNARVTPYLLAANRLVATSKTPVIEEPVVVYPAMNGDNLTGVWEGSFPVIVGRTEKVIQVVSDKVTMVMNPANENQLLLAMASVGELYAPPNEWYIQENQLIFTVNDAPWLASVALHFAEDGSLSGTYLQYGETHQIQFRHVATSPPQTPLSTKFILEGKSQDEWLKTLKNYPSYSASATPIPFTYDLYNWAASMPLISAYRLDAIYEEYRYQSDTALMKALLDLVSDNFKHDGAQVIPDEGMDAVNAVNFCAANGAIECRGLSSILSEMLRLCGVPAKAIMCIPTLDPSEDCHVVVHAYSYDLGQWIMLDPTYHLMLQNADGAYVSLPMLRDTLIADAPLIANTDAGHNKMPFSMSHYRAYMSKNLFRFSCATRFYASSVASKEANTVHMLTPVGWTVPYRWSRLEKITTSAADFWAAPPPEPEPNVEAGGSNLLTNNGDFFVLGGSTYMNTSAAEWVEAFYLNAGDLAGTLLLPPTDMPVESSATLLPAGTRIFECRGNNRLLLVEMDGSLVPYVRWVI